MPKPNDATWHQQRERDVAQHFSSLLDDKRFVIDTVDGRKPVTMFQKVATESDGSVAVKRQMIELGSSDHDLQQRLPVHQTIDVTLRNVHLLIFEKTFAHVRFMSLPPTKALIRGEAVEPLGDRDVRNALATMPPPFPGAKKSKVPLTVVLFSSAGFTKEATLLADRLAERTLILIEPSDAGGWTIHGTPETQGVLDLLDPEGDDEKRKRVRDAIHDMELELGMGGVAAEKLATLTQVRLNKVEDEFKRIAAERRGLVVKRMDGRLVLYRESTPPPAVGARMPIIDKFRSIFASGDEKKLSFLAERRAQIAQQQERVQAEATALEGHEAELRQQFKSNESAIVRKRITTQLVQLRKEIDRKTQLLGMLNQQSNVVAAHLHSLELIQQGKSVKLPTGEELANDAAKAEEVLAQVQADAELADDLVGTTSVRAGMNNEEAAVFDELMAEMAAPQPAGVKEVPLKQQGDALGDAAPRKPLITPPAMPPIGHRRSDPQSG